MKKINDLLLSLALSLVSLNAGAADPTENIRLSSVGYVPERAKIASIVGQTSGAFSVVREDGTQAFSGDLFPLGSVGIADFSTLTEEGNFYLDVDGQGRSVEFPIAVDAMSAPFDAVMLGFYGWRSGIDISFTYNKETYSHNAGHLNDAYLDFVGEPGVVKDGTGGWYDAGDYGKYIVNSACAVGVMLRAWEDFSDVLEGWTLSFIPETGGDIPDYLDEVKFNIDWMLKMQFDDGTVSHKLTPVDFAGFIMPDEDRQARYFSKWGSAATAGFVATAAQASRVYGPYDAAYADRLLEAAQLSYDFLTENTQNVSADLSDFNNAQYQTTDGDDRIWAAAEMWETTGDEAALADFETRIQNQASTGGGQSALFEVQWDWPNLKNMGVHTYLKSTRPGRDSQLVQTLEEAVVSAADEIVDTGENGVEGYGRAYENYYWGSNGVVARSTLTLKHAYDISGDTKYLDACMNQIANLTGRNQYGRSYITGVGFHPPENPHDRRSGASGHAYPGYLVGGGSTIDNYEDVEENYEVNEIAINWQGAMAYALALFLSPAAADADTDTDTDTNSDTAADIGTNMITATSGGCSCAAPGGTLHEPSSIFALTMLAFE